MMLQRLAWIISFAAGLAIFGWAPSVHAGVIIVDGTTVGSGIDPLDPAMTRMNKGDPDENTQEPPDSGDMDPLPEDEAAVYLWACFLFNTAPKHHTVISNNDPNERDPSNDNPTNPFMSQIVQDLGEAPSGGCGAAPAGWWAALLGGVVLLRRRK